MSNKPTSVDNFRGITALLISQSLFITSDSFVKTVGAIVPATQIMAVRGLMAVSLAVMMLIFTVERSKWHYAFNPRVILRALLEAFSAGLFILSLPHLTLAAITVIMQITPLTITLLSALVLREHVGWRRWLAIIIGFVGVILVAQPGSESFTYYSISAVLVALIISVRDLLTRRLDPMIPTASITFSTTLSVCLLGFVTYPLQTWQPLTLELIVMMFASAALVTLANIFIIRAFRGVDISVVSPFRYFGVVWGMLLGYLVWSDVPNLLAISGTILIVASGLYTMHRETQRFRQGA